jgi:hypothetical protein
LAPRAVQVAFWCWLTAAALLLLGGLLEVWLLRDARPANGENDQVRSLILYYRGVGVLCIVLGIAIGYLAGRTRRGDKRFRRAIIALSIASVVVLLAAEISLRGVSLPAIVALIPLLMAVVSVTRDSATAWFDAVEAGRGR